MSKAAPFELPEPTPQMQALRGRKDGAAMTAKRHAFLELVAKGTPIHSALYGSCLSKSTYEAWRKDDPDFLDEYETAYARGSDFIESALLADAMKPGNWVAKLAMAKSRKDKRHFRENHSLDVTVVDKGENARAALALIISDMRRRQAAALEGATTKQPQLIDARATATDAEEV